MADKSLDNITQDESVKNEEVSSGETPQKNLGNLLQAESVTDEEKSSQIIPQESSDTAVQDESVEEEKIFSGATPQENLGNLGQDESVMNGEESSQIIQQENSNTATRDESVEDEKESSEVTQQEIPNNLGPDESTEDEEKAEVMKQERPDNLRQDGSSEDEEKFEKSPTQGKSEFEKQIKNIFIRPSHLEPRHPIISSPFARRIATKAFGPKKPTWYAPLTSAQLYLFKELVNFVEIGRQGLFNFDAFMETLQDFDPGITRAEVLDILENMEKDEFEELDFGKFLFLLAYEDDPDVKDEADAKTAPSTPVLTTRQCLILSAISYYILITSPEDITRYYVANTRRKSTILHYHLEAARLVGLTEKQMEEKQKKATQHLSSLFALTGSPYAYPVPFVPRTKKSKTYREFTDRKLSRPRTALPMQKKLIQRPITPIKQSRELGGPVIYKTKDDKTFYDMHYGRIPMPKLKIPEKMQKEINRKYTVEHKDYISRKAYEAVGEYKDRLKEATVLYNSRILDTILKTGFPTISEEEDFIELFKRYMPLKLKDIKNFSLWVKPADYEQKHDEKKVIA